MGDKMVFDIDRIKMNMQDDISKVIYSERLAYNVKKEINRIRKIMDVQGTSMPILSFLEKNKKRNKVIFGAGYWGKQIRELFPEIDWRGFADNNAKEGQQINGLPCLTLNEAFTKWQDSVFVVATSKFGSEMKEQLIQFGAKENDIFLLNDYMEKLEKECQYFDLPFLTHDAEEVFVDIGALDGNTTKKFINWCSGDFHHAYVFEPNPHMKETLQKITSPKISLISKALSNESGEAVFYCEKEGREGSSHVIEVTKGKMDVEQTVVPVVTLDEELADKKVTFLKLDVEGFEENVLLGAEKIIRNNKPKIAVCIYHRTEDMWRIPSLLMEFRSDYKFYVRHYSWDSDETVLYAI